MCTLKKKEKKSGDSTILEMPGTWDIQQQKLKSQNGTDRRLSPNQ